MNESLDLRNRILKMRESNNLVLDKVNLESKTINTYSEIIPQKNQNDLNQSEISLEPNLEKEGSPIENKKVINKNFKNDENSNKQSLDNLVNDNEAQFRIIAKKFNEAVEVILELSDKVKNLEETVHNLSIKSSKNKKSYFFFNLKTFVIFILIILILLGLFTFPIDLTFIELIITEIISSI